MKVFTIGVYGWSEEDFAQAIRDAAPDLFVDVRRRRGLRGATYAWANSTRLQATLADLGIPYVHRLDVAPSDATRHIVARDAIAEGIGYRDRIILSPEYHEAYGQEVLATFDAQDFVGIAGRRCRINHAVLRGTGASGVSPVDTGGADGQESRG